MTKEDLQIFRVQLLDDIKGIIESLNKKDELPEWLKSKEVRKILTASPGTLQNLRVCGKLHPVKIEGSWYYSKDEIRALFIPNK